MNRYASLEKTITINLQIWQITTSTLNGGGRHEIQFHTKQNKPTARLVMSKHTMFPVSARNTARDNRSRCSPKAIPLSPGPVRKFNRTKHYPDGPHFSGCRQHVVRNHIQPRIPHCEARKVNRTSADRKRADDLMDGSFF